MAGQIERRVASPPCTLSSSIGASGSTIDSTGTWMRRSSGLRTPASTIGAVPLRPDEEARHLVERPLGRRKADALHVAAGRRPRRSSVRARWEPRFVCATAWISSTMTHSRAGEELARLRGEHEVEGLGRGDEDVGRRAQHLAPLALRRVAGAHRHAHVGADAAQRRLEVALDVVAERLERRDVDEPQRRARVDRPASGSATKRSSAHRKAASVLPEPVGAEMSACRPEAIAGQACAWAGVGSAKARANQSRTCGVNAARAGCATPAVRTSEALSWARVTPGSVRRVDTCCCADARSRGSPHTRPRHSHRRSPARIYPAQTPRLARIERDHGLAREVREQGAAAGEDVVAVDDAARVRRRQQPLAAVLRAHVERAWPRRRAGA